MERAGAEDCLNAFSLPKVNFSSGYSSNMGQTFAFVFV